MDAQDLWNRYRQYLCRVDSLELALDISRMHFDEFLARWSRGPAGLHRHGRAREGRHRQSRRKAHGRPLLAACAAARAGQGDAQEITRTVAAIKNSPPTCTRARSSRPAPRFTQVLAIGIGGSALGPEFVSHALGDPAGGPHAHPFLRQHRSRRHRPHARNAQRTPCARRFASSRAKPAARRRRATACSSPRAAFGRRSRFSAPRRRRHRPDRSSTSSP